MTGLGVAQQLGFAVPDDLSIVAWDDSLLCQVVHPPLTAVTRDIPAYGISASRRLCALVQEGVTSDLETPRGELNVRKSTGPAPSQASENARQRRFRGPDGARG